MNCGGIEREVFHELDYLSRNEKRILQAMLTFIALNLKKIVN